MEPKTVRWLKSGRHVVSAARVSGRPAGSSPKCSIVPRSAIRSDPLPPEAMSSVEVFASNSPWRQG